MKIKYIALLYLVGTLLLISQPIPRQTPPKQITGAKSFKDSFQTQEAKKQETVRLIVEFKEEPFFIASTRNVGFKKSAAFYTQRFAEFSSAIGIPQTSNKSLNKSSNGVYHEYFKAFFGASLSIPSDKIHLVTSLSYVKTVHYDREVNATLEKSIPQIGADQIWQTFGNQGEGIKVGIIDSGIDYMHPALGGGFGSGFKVAGGFDFVNGDTDPMDDNGHGTHVAGIVSADAPTLKGVAPKSILYAYKVLNSSGSGLESDIISAVERVVDPNDDGDASDKLDIANLSLGSDEGNPNDASSIAVNNASKLGVVFVIAAGNKGFRTPTQGKEENYFYNGSASIGSPGTAELAITVGAADSIDQFARFSSKGPNRTTFGIKPDILAPGVFINSAYLGGTIKSLNGTSMATPMVSGVVALLKSIHPDWSVERIKSAIINTAKDIGVSTYKQGGGRIQAFKSASSTSWIKPALLHLGLDDPSAASWVRKDTFIVYNAKNISQDYTTSVGVLQNGISMTISPSAFTIPSGDSAQIIVTTTVNNAIINTAPEDIPLYTGRLALKGSADTLAIPWAFARASRLTITFNEADPSFFGNGTEQPIFIGSFDANWVSPTIAEFYGYAKGIYDFYTLFRSSNKSRIVFNEKVTLDSDDQTLNISSSEATLPFVFHGKDHEGKFLSSYPSARKVVVSTIPFWGDQVSIIVQSSDTIMLSPASERYSFRALEYHFDPATTKNFHIAQYPTFTGLSTGKEFTNSASDYISQNFHFQFPPSSHNALILGEFFSYKEVSGTGYQYPMGYDFDTVSVANEEYTFKGYFQRSLEPARDVSLGFYTLYDVASEYFDVTTFQVMPYKDSIIAVSRDYISRLTLPRSPDGGTVSFGTSPVHLVTVWYNNSFGPGTLHFNTFFRGAQRETRYSDVNYGTYSVYDMDGNKLFSNPLNGFPRGPQQLSAKRYKMVVTASNYWLRNKKGSITQTSEFDLGNTQASPPSLMSFMVLNNQGQPVHSFTKGDTGSVIFSAKVIDSFTSKVNPDSTKVWYRVHNTLEWKTLPFQFVTTIEDGDGAIFKANLASALMVDSAAIDLRVFVKDSIGHTNDLQISPAFVVGNWISSDPNGVKENPDPTIPKEFTLYQNYPNPFNPTTTIRFGLPSTSTVNIEIFNILGQKIDVLKEGTLSAGFHNAKWNAHVPSGIYFYRVVVNSSDGNARSVSQTKKMILLR